MVRLPKTNVLRQPFGVVLQFARDHTRNETLVDEGMIMKSTQSEQAVVVDDEVVAQF